MNFNYSNKNTYVYIIPIISCTAEHSKNKVNSYC